MDWFGNRKEESFEYRRVDRSDWSEGAAWPQVTGGTIELSALSDLKASGSLSFEGEAMPDDDAQRMQQIGTLLQFNPDVSAYLLAEFRFQRMLSDIFKILADVAGVDLDALVQG